jgi:hypothetical protein
MTRIDDQKRRYLWIALTLLATAAAMFFFVEW